MNARMVRVNELVQRELSSYLRKYYQSESASVTLTGVSISPDLKTGRVFVSCLGSVEEAGARLRWLQSKAGELRRHVGATVVLRWTPELVYELDATPERAERVLRILDDLKLKEEAAAKAPTHLS